MDDSFHPEPSFIAINPPNIPSSSIYDTSAHPVSNGLSSSLPAPPTFDQSKFAIIYRRQRIVPPNTLKTTFSLPSRFIHLPNTFEFSGWGSVTRLVLGKEEEREGEDALKRVKSEKVLGQFTASALVGNAILGSVFYAIPAVVGVAGIYSPFALLVAASILFLWRPIMVELASALPISGAPYTYLLNVSTKPLALLSAALLLLDFSSTSIISASTAAMYLAGEIELPFPPWVGAVIILVLFICIGLMGLKDSARIALGVLVLHVVTMLVLILASTVHWAQIGAGQLKDNWNATRTLGGGNTPSQIAKQIYLGTCLGMLGLTGFECTPAYVSRIKDNQFPKVLRNLHLPAIALNTILMLLVLAIIPLDTILTGANVLSVLSLKASGRWLRIWIVVDAIVVLCGGVLTGIISACELLERLAADRAIPKVFLRTIPRTKAPYISILCFGGFCGLLYATTAGRQDVVSLMFSLVWLCVMSLFPLSLILLKFNRGRLRRGKKTTLITVFGAFVIAAAAIAGNIALNPRTFGYFAAYFIGVMAFFMGAQNKIHLLRWVYWVYDQYPRLHQWNVTCHWGDRLVRAIAQLKKQSVCVLVKSDEISQLFRMVLYVRKNEETSCLKIVHFYEEEKGVPSELEANARILDEAFPEITVDLILIPGKFEPKNVAALAYKLNIPTSLMFMSCPGQDFEYGIEELGSRIILL